MKRSMNMLKRMLCLLFVVTLLLPVLPVMAEESSADMLMLEELRQWANDYKIRALASAPLNDPYAEESNTDDGYMFVYDFATLYMDGPEMTPDSVVQALVILSSEEEGLRGVRVDDPAQFVLDAYYTENPDLVGNSDQALLYAIDLMPEGGYTGILRRNGQRIEVIDYAVYEQLATGGDGYTDAGIMYTIQDNNVMAIRAYGLDTRFLAGDVSAALEDARELGEETSYSRVQTSYVGTELEPFTSEDLIFAGIDFVSLTAEDAAAAFGEPLEDVWLSDGDGWMRAMQFESCELTFLYDSQRQTGRVKNMTIDTDLLEGPRSVRVGDTVASVMTRFRSGEGEYDGTTELLYGDANSATFGMAEYGSDAIVLRYGAETEEGTAVIMYLSFEPIYLSEILLLVNE
ncbi:MAG: hypothetical protein J1E43_09505 [Christensenellaceae bacterium]|nr:hypothetical protein [Christensenellaceae bacterium]